MITFPKSDVAHQMQPIRLELEPPNPTTLDEVWPALGQFVDRDVLG